MKKLILTALAAVLLCVPGAALAGEAYDITDYDVHITVAENNVIEVAERLTLNFTEQRHGFYYALQTRGTITRKIDGRLTESRYNDRVYDFRVAGDDFELSREDEFLVAKIGDADRYVTGEKQYLITYKCDLGVDRSDGFDDFYRNLIVCDDADTIESARFIIEMPKDFDADGAAVGLGSYGSDDTLSVYWEKDGLALKGYALRPMRGGEILTVRIGLPEGYFVGATDAEANWDAATYIASALCVLLALALWAAFGRDRRLFPTVEFYPPDGMTPAEAGYVIDACVDDKDVVSLILYWADKGCLEIVERKKNKFELVKLKEPENAKSFETPMFNKLFAKGDAVAVSSLKYTFYSTMAATKTAVSNYFEGSAARRLFTPASKRARAAMYFITMLPIGLTLYRMVYTGLSLWLVALMAAVAGGWFISLPVFLLAHVTAKWRSAKKGSRIAKLIGSVAALAAVLFIYALIVSASEGVGAGVPIVTACATVALLLLTIIMRKHTSQGGEWLAKLMGFKEFIDKAEKSRILTLVEQNPSYFYNVLPYAYVLGVTDKWAKNFEGIGIEPPQWYHGYHGMSMFNTVLFTSTISRNLSGFQTAMVSRPASSGGGGFSGGGFGGGGFSGGGGGGGGASGSW